MNIRGYWTLFNMIARLIVITCSGVRLLINELDQQWHVSMLFCESSLLVQTLGTIHNFWGILGWEQW